MNILLIGKPNVGKSSIYNLLANKNINIVHSQGGTTRDWHLSEIDKCEGLFIYDTPGILIKKNKIDFINYNNLLQKIDIFFYVVEYKNKQNATDNEAINLLRKFNKQIILIINKDDNFKNDNIFDELGINNKFYISCSHKLGITELKNFISKYKSKKIINDKYDYSIAIFGKPNAGKSTLLNNIVGYNRSNTNSNAGTTSDIVQEYFYYKNKKIKLLDTAGIIKKSKIIKSNINYYAIKKSLSNINKVDLSLLIIDSYENFDNQSKKIFNLLINKSSSVLIVFNKIDLIINKKKYISETKIILNNSISFIKNISSIFICAKNKSDIIKIKKLVFTKIDKHNIKFPTNKINNWLKNSTSDYTHPLIKGKKVNFKYATQIKERPITIKIFTNFSLQIKSNYKAYLLNSFNKTFKIKDQKIKLIFSSSKNPYNL